MSITSSAIGLLHNNAFWKVYYWTLIFPSLIFAPVLLLMIFILPFADSRINIESIIACIAVYQFVNRKWILSAQVWKWLSLYFLVFGVLDVVYVVLRQFSVPLAPVEFFFETSFSSFPLFIIFFLILSLPMYYAMYRLGWTKNPFLEEEKVLPDSRGNPTRYSKTAIASAIFGSGSLLLGPVLGIPGLITGIIAVRRIKNKNLKGNVLAWYGILFSIFLSALWGYMVYVAMIFFQSAQNTEYSFNGEIPSSMSKQEQMYIQSHIHRITTESTPENVAAILGKPKQKTYLPLMHIYECPEKVENCSLGVVFIDGTAQSVVWTSLGRFQWSKDLDITGAESGYTNTGEELLKSEDGSESSVNNPEMI